MQNQSRNKGEVVQKHRLSTIVEVLPPHAKPLNPSQNIHLLRALQSDFLQHLYF